MPANLVSGEDPSPGLLMVPSHVAFLQCASQGERVGERERWGDSFLCYLAIDEVRSLIITHVMMVKS